MKPSQYLTAAAVAARRLGLIAAASLATATDLSAAKALYFLFQADIWQIWDTPLDNIFFTYAHMGILAKNGHMGIWAYGHM